MARSRVVSLLRVILPLAALALLSTLFLFGNRPEVGGGLPYSDVTPEELARRPIVTAPTYAGVAEDGTQIEMTATSANPQDIDGRSAARDVHLILRGTDGLVSDVQALQGEMLGDNIHLRGDVRMVTSTGWTMVSDEFTADTREGTLRSDRQVDVEGPFGTLTAGSMILRRLEDNDKNHVLDLNDGVRMIYLP